MNGTGATLLVMITIVCIGQVGCRSDFAPPNAIHVLTIVGTGAWDQGNIALWSPGNMTMLDESHGRILPERRMAVSPSRGFAAWITFDYYRPESSHLSIWSLSGPPQIVFEVSRSRENRFEELLWLADRLLISTDTDELLQWSPDSPVLEEFRTACSDENLIGLSQFEAHVNAHDFSSSTRRLVHLVPRSVVDQSLRVLSAEESARGTYLTPKERDLAALWLLGELTWTSLDFRGLAVFNDLTAADAVHDDDADYWAVADQGTMRLYELRGNTVEMVSIPLGKRVVNLRIGKGLNYVVATLEEIDQSKAILEDERNVSISAEPQQIPSLWLYDTGTKEWVCLSADFGRRIALIW